MLLFADLEQGPFGLNKEEISMGQGVSPYRHLYIHLSLGCGLFSLFQPVSLHLLESSLSNPFSVYGIRCPGSGLRMDICVWTGGVSFTTCCLSPSPVSPGWVHGPPAGAQPEVIRLNAEGLENTDGAGV